MALTMTRWLAVAGGTCALIATASISSDPARSAATESSLEQVRLNDLRGRVALAAERWHALARRDSLIARLPARNVSSTAPLLAIDPRLSGPHRSLIERAVRRQWNSLGIDSARIPVAIAVVIDTAPSADGLGRGRGQIAYDYQLPVRAGAGAGERCVVIATIQSAQSARADEHRELAEQLATQRAGSSLLGPCAFLARFGLPGTEIDAWLRSRSWDLAAHPHWWTIPIADSVPVGERWKAANDDGASIGGLFWLSPDALGCTAGKVDRCDDALPAAVAGDSLPFGGLIITNRARDPHWGTFSGRYISDLVTALGPDEFERFWRSDRAPDAALRAVAAIGLDTWTSQWARGLLGEQRVGPRLSLAELIIGLTVAGVCLLLSASAWGRRQVR